MPFVPQSDFSVTVRRFEPCPDCRDGSCGACGAQSSEDARPGVKLVTRKLVFERCECARGCAKCGENAHPMAGPGVRVATTSEASSKRWVPAVHMRDAGDEAFCGGGAGGLRATAIEDVTCKRCRNYYQAGRRRQ